MTRHTHTRAKIACIILLSSYFLAGARNFLLRFAIKVFQCISRMGNRLQRRSIIKIVRHDTPRKLSFEWRKAGPVRVLEWNKFVGAAQRITKCRSVVGVPVEEIPLIVHELLILARVGGSP